jgi:hypothetical protein
LTGKGTGDGGRLILSYEVAAVFTICRVRDGTA